jgi:hypothetical protein
MIAGHLPSKDEDMAVTLDTDDYGDEDLRQYLRGIKGIDVLARHITWAECELCSKGNELMSLCRDTGGEFEEPVYLCDDCIAEIWSRTRTPAPGANVDLPVTMKRGGMKA